jgi:hypothetical protein
MHYKSFNIESLSYRQNAISLSQEVTPYDLHRTCPRQRPFLDTEYAQS